MTLLFNHRYNLQVRTNMADIRRIRPELWDHRHSSQKTELNGKRYPSNVGSKQLAPARACILQWYQDNIKVDTSWIFLVQISRGYIQTGPSVAIRYKSGPRLNNLSWQSNGRTYLDTLHGYFSEFHNTNHFCRFHRDDLHQQWRKHRPIDLLYDGASNNYYWQMNVAMPDHMMTERLIMHLRTTFANLVRIWHCIRPSNAGGRWRCHCRAPKAPRAVESNLTLNVWQLCWEILAWMHC